VHYWLDLIDILLAVFLSGYLLLFASSAWRLCLMLVAAFLLFVAFCYWISPGPNVALGFLTIVADPYIFLSVGLVTLAFSARAYLLKELDSATLMFVPLGIGCLTAGALFLAHYTTAASVLYVAGASGFLWVLFISALRTLTARA